MKESIELKTKTVLITGAAGRIGSECARQAVEAGADVLLADICEEKLGELVKNLGKNSESSVYMVVCDVTIEEGLDELLTKAKTHFPKITSAVHCAYPVSSGWGTKFGELKASSCI